MRYKYRWDAWKKFNKEGFDCTISFSREKNFIIATTENAGISVKCITEIKDGTDNIYIALTGDQVAITGIHIKK